MDHAGQPAQYRQANINQEIGTASSLHEHGDGREEEREEVEEDIAPR